MFKTVNEYKPKLRKPIKVFNKFGCYFRLKFDSALGGDCHKCKYCYRTGLLNNNNSIGRANNNKLYADIKYLERLLQMASETDLDKPKNDDSDEVKVIYQLQQKMPVRFGSMCDPFDPDNDVKALTIQAIDLMNRYNHPYLIYTKNDFTTNPEVIRRLKQSGKDVLIHISLSNLDDKNGFVLESKAPSCFQRLQAIKTLIENKVPVVLRIAPIILGVNDKDVIKLMIIFKAIGGKKVVIEELRIGAEFKTFLEKHYPQAIKFFPKEPKWNYYRYDESIIKPKFEEFVDGAKKLDFEIAICGNHQLENELCNNDNCCLFDNPQIKFRQDGEGYINNVVKNTNTVQEIKRRIEAVAAG